MIGRKRVVRKVESITLDGTVVDLPPSWCFTISCQHHGEIRFDFDPWCRRDRDDLVMHVRDAVWSLRHELVGITLQGIFQQLATYFLPFLDDLEKSGCVVSRLSQIDEKVVRDFLAWLERRIAGGGGGGPVNRCHSRRRKTPILR